MSGACFSPEGPSVLPKEGQAPSAVLRGSVSDSRFFKTEIIGDSAALGRLIPQWEDLAANALEPNPFYEHWMLLPALECFAKPGEVEIFTLWKEGRLAALFPFTRARRYRGLPVGVLSAWRHRHCLLTTPLVRAEGAAGSCAALLGWLRAEAPLLEISYLQADGPFNAALALAGARACADNQYERALLVKERDADSYIAGSLSRHLRQELRRRERRLGERGKVTHTVMRPDGDLERWVDEFLRLEAAGWKGREGSALACSESNRRFATEIFGGAFARGRLHMVGVDLDGKPLARCLSILAGEGSYAFKTAYDEEFARYSPGVIVEVDRIREFHGLPGAQWMDSFTAPDNKVLDSVWKGRRAIQRLLIGAGPRGRLAIAALPLLSRAKKLLRGRTPK
jgi:CelD/BcsL family acetyltransferase involved in cellulose biosynthesis